MVWNLLMYVMLQNQGLRSFILIQLNTVNIYAKNTASFLGSMQGILAMDDGVPFDFEIEHHSEYLLKITGNLKTALIVLRHTGLISPTETNDAAKLIDNPMKKHANNKTYEEYNNNFKKAKRDFNDSAEIEYCKKALVTFFGLENHQLISHNSF